MKFSKLSVGIQAGGTNNEVIVMVLTDSVADGVIDGVSDLGGSIENTHVSPTEDFNRAAWGEDYDMKDILSQPGGKLESAQELREALVKATKTSFEM
jgi:hypothetical protein